MSEQLKPCPFCGSEAEIDFGFQGPVGEENTFFYVTCESCDTTVGWSKDKAEVAATWNRRTRPTDSEGEEVSDHENNDV